MKLLQSISRLFVGIVFVFSGFVKAVDPLGSTYKFLDYFTAFGLDFFDPLAFPLAIILSSVELVLGISLLLGYRMRTASWVLLIFMSFFTILTLILALTNPVQDCGCFGDALILTNWETFWKNVIIMFFTLFIFIHRNKYSKLRSVYKEWGVILFFLSGTVFLSVYCYENLPVLDFRPYKQGTYIPDGMIIPEGAPQSEFETTLIYRNKINDEEQEFSMEDFPEDTMKWEFVDALSVQISEGYEPPIHDFNIIASEGIDITDDLIRDPGYSFLLITYDVMESDYEALKDANRFFRLSQAHPDIKFYAITSSLKEESDSLKTTLGLQYSFFQADEITLKTIIRSNPGLLLLKNGTIMAKWHYNNFPSNINLGELGEIADLYPFCPGCDLEIIRQTPPYLSEGSLESVLFYRNLTTGVVQEFSMDNFPVNSDEWVFENTITRSTGEGFQSVLDKLEITSAYGMDYTDIILNNDAFSLLFFMSDPGNLTDDEFNALNKLGGLSSEYLNDRVDVFAITSLEPDAILDYTSEHVSAFEYFSANLDILDSFGNEGLEIVLLNNSRVLSRWEGSSGIPDPSVFADIEDVNLTPAEVVLNPYILKTIARENEKKLVYLFVLVFFFIALVLRVYFNLKEPDA